MHQQALTTLEMRVWPRAAKASSRRPPQPCAVESNRHQFPGYGRAAQTIMGLKATHSHLLFPPSRDNRPVLPTLTPTHFAGNSLWAYRAYYRFWSRL